MTSPSPSADSERLLAERYGVRPPGHRSRLRAVLAVLVVAALVWLVWAAWASDPDVEAELLGWEVVSGSEVEVELLVHRDTEDTVTCTLVAQADDSGVVGETAVRIPAGETGEQRVTATVRTEREALSVKLTGCD